MEIVISGDSAISVYWFFIHCYCFCFFKQKTAYEMRISDWSSDVCSSDLLCRGRAGGRLGRDSGAGHRRGRPAEPAAVPRLCAAVLQSSAPCRLHETAPLVREIGRASCRERVCQYV